MSKYTTEVRFICENASGLDKSEGYRSINEIISKARPKVFNFDYPIFDEDYRSVLESKILKHYYTREIGEETVGLWKLRLETRLNEIMPYYNKLYESEKLAFNPISNYDLTTDHKGKGTSNALGREKLDDIGTLVGDVNTTTDSSTITDDTTHTDDVLNNEHVSTHNNGDVWTLYSDTPQGGINGIVGAEDAPSLGSNGYLTNATHVIDGSTPETNTNADRDVDVDYDGNTTVHATQNVHTDQTSSLDRTRNTTSDINTTDDYLNKVTGYGAYSPNKLLAEYRKNLLNIDLQIINDLEDLFFQLW